MKLTQEQARRLHAIMSALITTVTDVFTAALAALRRLTAALKPMMEALRQHRDAPPPWHRPLHPRR